LKAGSTPRHDGDRPDDEAPPGESAADAATAPPAASKPGETGALSRRGAAAAISERDAEIERLVAERRAADDRAQAHQQRLAAVEAEQAAASQAVLAEIGDDREFARLQDARLRNRTLSYEEDERLDRMIAARETAHVYWQLAERGHKTGVARLVADKVDQHGLDRAVAFGSDLPALLDHAVAVTEARVRSEQSERIKELETERQGFKTRAAANGRSAPLVGGSSAGSGPAGRMPEDGSSPLDWFRAGAREREASLTKRR